MGTPCRTGNAAFESARTIFIGGGPKSQPDSKRGFHDLVFDIWPGTDYALRVTGKVDLSK